MVNIKGLGKAEVLRALWYNSHTQGMSYIAKLKLKGNDFTLELAQELVDNTPSLYFDYVFGHVIKCDISGDEFDPRLYDRDCGGGAAQRAIDKLTKEIEMINNTYNGPVLSVVISSTGEDNDRIAQAFHEAFRGRPDYVESNVIINKDPDITTGKEQTGIYICLDDLKDPIGVMDALVNVLKSTSELIKKDETSDLTDDDKAMEV